MFPLPHTIKITIYFFKLQNKCMFCIEDTFQKASTNKDHCYHFCIYLSVLMDVFFFSVFITNWLQNCVHGIVDFACVKASLHLIQHLHQGALLKGKVQLYIFYKLLNVRNLSSTSCYIVDNWE